MLSPKRSEVRDPAAASRAPSIGSGGGFASRWTVIMTPEERDLITTLLDRLRSIVGQPKDPEADRLIGQAVAKIPDAPYYLVQTVLIQDIALHQAETHIAELEEQLATAEAQQPAPTSFLGGLFGRRQRAQSSASTYSPTGTLYYPAAPFANVTI